MAPLADFRADAAWARAQDDADPLHDLRGEFLIPPHTDGAQTYLVGNSLGLEPRGVRQALLDELDDWARLGVEGHLHARHPWLPYHREVRDGLADIVGAEPIEVAAMNSLTTNLHLLMVSFYRPTPARHAILIERNAFPSDRDLAASQIRFHGFDPAESLIEVDPDEAGGTLSMAAIERALAEHGPRIALVLLPGVQYLTGQAFDIAAITKLAHAHGCVAGFDCAHAAGNIDLRLHDSDCDFAAWCSYKYLNSGRISKRVASLRPHQPSKRGNVSRAWRACTNAPATAPGPELRYLYEHHAAKSQSLSCRCRAILPAACAQSKPTMQPCARAIFVIAARSND
jgi:kynureninase